jgi:hypothetical protein
MDHFTQEYPRNWRTDGNQIANSNHRTLGRSGEITAPLTCDIWYLETPSVVTLLVFSRSINGNEMP